MSVFKKLKDVLFDIEEEEIPVITKDEEDEEENPIKEIKVPKEEFHEERVIETKKETKFNFPLDDDFDEIVPSRSKRDYFDDEDLNLRSSFKDNRIQNDFKKNNTSNDYARFNLNDVKKEEVKTFKPSPVISPVYGILDQNYTKDDVIVKNDGSKRKDTSLNLDDVRKKAYGEDEVDRVKRIDEILDDDNDEVIAEIKNPKSDMTIREAEDIADKNSKPDIIDDDKNDNDVESDLFNLIDSMYEDKNKMEEDND